jgi:hypothetical protein
MVEKSSFASEDDPPIVFATAVPPASAPYYDDLSPSGTIGTEWNCPQCTLINPISEMYCDACYHRKPNIQESKTTTIYTKAASGNGMFYEKNRIDTDSRHLIVLDDDIDIQQENDRDDDEEETRPVEEDPYHKKIRRRCRRKRRMAAGGLAGCVVGSILLCFPVGAIIGAVTGAWTARAISKRRERVKDDRLAKERLVSADRAPPSSSFKVVE